jgi:CBS domain containing-hemolysin-like protein
MLRTAGASHAGVLGALLSPISWLTAGANKAFLALLGHKSEAATEGEVVTQPELRLILSGASQSGSVDGYEQDMIEGVLDLQRTQVSQIMTPRVELAAVEATSTLAQLLDVTEEYKYSRVPFPEPSLNLL